MATMISLPFLLLTVRLLLTKSVVLTSRVFTEVNAYTRTCASACRWPTPKHAGGVAV